MSRSDPAAHRASGADTPLPVSGDEPAFAEPWQAQAFALAVHLHDTGAFAWNEWAQVLGGEIRGDDPRTAGTHEAAGYYHHWAVALERLAIERNLVDADALDLRAQAWAEAYRSTPHGSPVELPPGHKSQREVRPKGAAPKACRPEAALNQSPGADRRMSHLES